MKRNCYLFTFILSVCFIVASCSSYKSSIKPEDIQGKHDIIIIPYKAAPITVAEKPGVAMLFGLIGGAIQGLGGNSDREKFVDYMEKIRGTWEPSMIIAEECAKAIKSKSGRAFEINLVDNVREIPGAEKLRILEQRVFTARDKGTGFSRSYIGNWMDVGSDWLKKDSSNIVYKQEYPQNKADISLEAFASCFIMKEDELLAGVMLKLINTNTGQKIAAVTSYDSFKITPIKEQSDFDKFKSEFQYSMGQLCSKALGEMGLINLKNKF
jgi:hypothetical protein